MSDHLLILLEALLFILIFGGLPVLRKEGFSLRLVVEVLVVTGLYLGVSLAAGLRLQPALFLIVLYLIVMRSRILIDLGNLLSARGRHQQALSVYRLALLLAPEVPVRLLALTSYGAVLVRIGALDEAVRVLEGVLECADDRLLPKQESACHYNLGVAYLRLGNEVCAVREFNATVDAWPLSPYAGYANIALERRRKTGSLAVQGAAEDTGTADHREQPEACV